MLSQGNGHTHQTDDLPKVKTVLIAEDSPVQALSLRKKLEQEGLKVLCASNGAAALNMAFEYLPDAIVLDIQMPEMDGLVTCRRLKEDPRTVGIPVVILTAHNEPDILMQGLDDGALDFIPKDPFSEKILVETLRELHVLAPV